VNMCRYKLDNHLYAPIAITRAVLPYIAQNSVSRAGYYELHSGRGQPRPEPYTSRQNLVWAVLARPGLKNEAAGKFEQVLTRAASVPILLSAINQWR